MSPAYPRLSIFSLFFLSGIGLSVVPLAVAGAAAEEVSVRGSVVDPTGSPVASALVTFESAGRVVASVETDKRGAFSASGLATGRYTLRVSFPGLTGDPLALDLNAATVEAVTIHTHLTAHTDAVVVSANLVEGLLSSTPTPMTAFHERDVETRQAESITDLLRITQGVTVSRSGGAGALTSVFPRGGESNYSLVLVDGIRVNDLGGGFDFASLPVADVARLEVVRGPQSAVFGADAIGGVIHVISRSGGPTRVDALSEAGSWSSSRLSIGAAGSRGLVSWGGGAERSASDGFNGAVTPRGERVSNDDGSQTAAGARVRLTAAQWRLGGQGRLVKSDRGYPGPFGTDPNHTSDGVDRVSRGRNTQATVGVLGEVALSPRVRTHGTFSYADLSAKFESPFGPSFSDTVRKDGRWQLDAILPSSVSVSGGAEVLDERARSTYITGRSSERLPIHRRGIGTFAEARAEFASRWTMSAGIRIEQIRRDALDADAFGQRPPLAESSITSTNPRAAISWLLRAPAAGPLSWTRLRANIGTGIRPPDAFEIAFTDNPNLEPERSRSYDIGLEQAVAGGRAIVDATWFDNAFDDLIIAVGPSFRDASRYRTDNIANARARGLEVSGSWRPVAAFSVRAAYSLIDSAILGVDGHAGTTPSPFEVGDALIRRPRHQGWLDAVATWRNATAFVHVGGRGRVLDVDPSFGAFGGRLLGPGYAVADMGASVKLWRGLAAFARLSNALNRNYEEALGFPSPGRRVTGGLRVAASR